MLHLHLGRPRLQGKPLCRQFNPAGRTLRAENTGKIKITDIQEPNFEDIHQSKKCHQTICILWLLILRNAYLKVVLLQP